MTSSGGVAKCSRLNAPVDHGGLTLYQSGCGGDEDLAGRTATAAMPWTYSILSISRKPGLWLIYVGFGGLVDVVFVPVGEYEHPHPGTADVPEQGPHVVGHDAEVLGDDRERAELSPQVVEERLSRSGRPTRVHGRLGIRRDGALVLSRNSYTV